MHNKLHTTSITTPPIAIPTINFTSIDEVDGDVLEEEGGGEGLRVLGGELSELDGGGGELWVEGGGVAGGGAEVIGGGGEAVLLYGVI